jgi:hypothetical protein
MTKQTLSTQALRKLVKYDPDTGIFTWRKGVPGKLEGRVAGCLTDSGYVRIQVAKQRHKAHRLAFIYMGEELPDMVDHINCVKTDNRWVNLRPADQSKNQCNRFIGSKNTSGFKGVSWHKRDERWQANIKSTTKLHHLGYFDTPELAYAAYCKAAIELHKEFANFGDPKHQPITSAKPQPGACAYSDTQRSPLR